MKVLIATDSRELCARLSRLLAKRDAAMVIETARSGKEAQERAVAFRPDTIIIDSALANNSAMTATREIMETCPAPVVVVCDRERCARTRHMFEAADAGAVAVIERPLAEPRNAAENVDRRFVETVILMAEVKVVTRKKRAELSPRPKLPPNLPPVPVVAIAASTGGPPVLKAILSGLPRDLPAALLIVQHISEGFLQGMCDWLQQSTGFIVRIPAHGELVSAGHAYLAPDKYHMSLSADGKIILKDDPPENGLRPAASYLFRAVMHRCGASAIAVVLTGMGKDGVEELRMIKQEGGITIAQNQASSTIYGMPGQAVAIDAASYVLNPEQIAAALPGFIERAQSMRKTRISE